MWDGIPSMDIHPREVIRKSANRVNTFIVVRRNFIEHLSSRDFVFFVFFRFFFFFEKSKFAFLQTKNTRLSTHHRETPTTEQRTSRTTIDLVSVSFT